MDRRKDGRTETLFYRTLPAEAGSPIKMSGAEMLGSRAFIVT